MEPEAAKKLIALERSIEEKRKVIKMLKSDYPISLLCNMLAVSRSSFYYRPAEADESELREAVNQLAVRFLIYGSRRLAAQLR
jgi:hypothetical protein